MAFFFYLIHFAEHADYLSQYQYAGGNNILLSQAVAFSVCRNFISRAEECLAMAKTGCDIINDQTSKLFLDDGMTNDLSLHYHIGILDGLYDLKRLLLQNEVPENLLSPNLNEVLLKCRQSSDAFHLPQLFYKKSSKDCTPAFNDSWVKTRSVLNKKL